MVFARNEDNGLRCVYHGWKFGADGACMDMPAEPADTPLCKNVRIKAYPVRERNGIAVGLHGARRRHRRRCPTSSGTWCRRHRATYSMRIQECNWLQALEGEIDSAHAAILHGRVDGARRDQRTGRQAHDLAPKFDCVQHEAGVQHRRRGASSTTSNDYVRVNQFLLPFYTLVPPQSQYPELSGHAWVPLDDEHTLCIMFSYHPSQPFYEKTRKIFQKATTGARPATGREPRSTAPGRPTPTPRTGRATTAPTPTSSDYATAARRSVSRPAGPVGAGRGGQSGVSPIYDRSKEHLGTSDTGIARARRLLLDSLRKLEADGTRPASATDPATMMCARCR